MARIATNLAAIRLRHGGRIAELWRFYSVGLINTVFGYGLFTIFVWSGVNLYLAQIFSHIIGMCFNYLMFTRHVFQGVRGSKLSYLGAYALNYAIGVTLLALFHHLTASAYVAGLLAMFGASLGNYVILKLFVFKRGPASG